MVHRRRRGGYDHRGVFIFPARAMKYTIEITNFIIRLDPICDVLGQDYQLAVAAVVADGKIAILKGLSSDERISHRRMKDTVAAAEQACADLGFKPDWVHQRDMKP